MNEMLPQGEAPASEKNDIRFTIFDTKCALFKLSMIETSEVKLY